VSLHTSIGTSGRYDLCVAVRRLIFFKLSLPHYGVGRCSAPCFSFTYAHSFLKNGAELTLYVWRVI
jgi:hypothetical protein